MTRHPQCQKNTINLNILSFVCRYAAVYCGSESHRDGSGAECSGTNHPGENPQHGLRLLQSGSSCSGLSKLPTTV